MSFFFANFLWEAKRSDARAAAIVMRTVRNTVDTVRTVVCTIHQLSVDIFEAFDEVNFFFAVN